MLSGSKVVIGCCAHMVRYRPAIPWKPDPFFVVMVSALDHYSTDPQQKLTWLPTLATPSLHLPYCGVKLPLFANRVMVPTLHAAPTMGQ